VKRKARKPPFQCGRCHKRYRNPLGHVCTVKTDYKRRTKQAAKDAAAAKRKARPQHPPPSACPDTDCQRAACVAYKEGVGAGYAAGHEDGYQDGFADGRASCPGGHD
jgi:hypothetical protein